MWPHVRDGVNGDVGCDAASLAGAGGCIVSRIGDRNDPESQSGSMSMMEAVSILVCVWGHEDAGIKQPVGESCGRRALLELSLYMLQGTVVVDGKLKPIFQVAEETGDFGRAGVKREAFRPEDRAAGDTVGHVVQEVLTVAGDWVSEVVRWDSDADGGSSSGD